MSIAEEGSPPWLGTHWVSPLSVPVYLTDARLKCYLARFGMRFRSVTVNWCLFTLFNTVKRKRDHIHNKKRPGLLGMWMWWNTFLLLCRLKMMSRWDMRRALISDILASFLHCATRWRCVIHLCLGNSVYDDNVCCWKRRWRWEKCFCLKNWVIISCLTDDRIFRGGWCLS